MRQTDTEQTGMTDRNAENSNSKQSVLQGLYLNGC